MHSLICFSFYLFLFITTTNGLNCVSCLSSANSGCNDPYDETTSGDIPFPYNTYCAKVVYPTYIERTAGGRSCTPGSGIGGSTIYCCSNKDYCNGTRRNISSMMVLIGLIIAKQIIN